MVLVWHADGNETSAAYYMAMTSTHTPSVIWSVPQSSPPRTQLTDVPHSLTRQNLPQLANSSIELANKGGYVAYETAGPADITLVATGSEVSIALEAAEVLKTKGVQARVASIPCFEVFDQQSLEYRLSVLPAGAPVLSVEAYTVRRPFLLFVWENGTDVGCGRRRWAGASTRTSRLGSTRLERRRRHLWSTRNLASPEPVSPSLLSLSSSLLPSPAPPSPRPPSLVVSPLVFSFVPRPPVERNADSIHPCTQTSPTSPRSSSRTTRSSDTPLRPLSRRRSEWI